MERIVISEAVAEQVEALVNVLFDKGYFAIKENAVKYVAALKGFINTIPKRQRYATKSSRYGEWFCRYKPNKHTTWYITFDTDEKTWLVRSIINNHTPGYATFLTNLK